MTSGVARRRSPGAARVCPGAPASGAALDAPSFRAQSTSPALRGHVPFDAALLRRMRRTATRPTSRVGRRVEDGGVNRADTRADLLPSGRDAGLRGAGDACGVRRLPRAPGPVRRARCLRLLDPVGRVDSSRRGPRSHRSGQSATGARPRRSAQAQRSFHRLFHPHPEALDGLRPVTGAAGGGVAAPVHHRHDSL